MIRKLLTLIVLILLVFILLITLALTTNLGARTVVALGSHWVPGKLSIGRVHGRFVSHMSVDDLTYHNEAVTVKLQQGELNWSLIALLEGQVKIKQLNLHGLNIQQQTSSPDQSDATYKHYPKLPKLKHWHWPIALSIDHVKLTDSQWQQAGMMVRVNRVAGHMHILPTGQASIHLKWGPVSWLSTPKQLKLTTPQGQLDLSGQIHHYQLKLKTQVHQYSQSIKAQIQGHAEGDLQHITIKNLQAKTLQGQMSVQGHVQWAPKLHWQIQFKTQGINSGQRWPIRVSHLNMDLTSQGQWSHESLLKTQLAISHLDGQLNQHQFTGHAHLTYNAHTLAVKDTRFKMGDNQLQAHGQISSDQHLTWQAHLARLDQLLPSLQGDVQLQGQLQGSLDKPQLKANLEAKGINYQQWHLHIGHAKAHIDWPQHSDIQVKLKQLTAPHQLKLQAVTLTGQGNLQHHQARLSVESHWGKLNMHMVGSYQADHWQGLLTQWSFQSSQLGSWQLQQPVLARYDKLGSVTPITIHDNHSAQFQLQGFWRSPTSWQVQGHVHQFNLKLLLPWLAHSIKSLDIPVNGNWSMTRNQQLRGHVHLRIPQGKIEPQRTESVMYLADSHLNMNLTPDKGLTIDSELQGKNPQWHTQMDVKLPDWHGRHLTWSTISSSLQGQIKGQIPKLNFLDGLIPETRSIKGQLQYNMHLSGHLKQPQLKGQAQLQNGQVYIRPLGIKLHRMQLKLNSDLQNLQLTGQVNSQDQTLHIQGHGNWQNNDKMPRLVINLQGQDLQVMNTPEYQIHASPQLMIVIQPPKISLTGHIKIPHARIEPIDLASVETLPDTVHIKGHDQNQAYWQVYLQTHIELGDDIVMQYQGLRAQLDGGIKIIHQPQQLMLGVGKLTVTKGSYRAYGHHIQINHGQLTFTGGSIMNPGLNILATRQIEVSHFGHTLDNSQSDIQVGFQVRGSANNPDISLYSSPSMSDQDILSYIAFGQPAEELSDSKAGMLMQAVNALGTGNGESVLGELKQNLGLTRLGVESEHFYNPDTQSSEQTSAFVVGKQLSDRLSVNYSVGILDPISVLRIEYKLTNNLSMRSEASPYGSGADLLYTIETN